VVLVANLLHIVPNPEQVLAEAWRILKAGTGKLLTPTYVHGETLMSRMISIFLQWQGHPLYVRYNSTSLKNLIESNHFEVISQRLVKNIIPSSFITARKV
jgi:ubiquinone/menaquinone biosynthesis C-methylase UbiE